jgi:carbon-monoxide dehydrogenase catalytic subunit
MARKYEKRSVDRASQQVLKKAEEENIRVIWDRLEAMQPQCGFGELGICCTNCYLGPCRIDPFGEGPDVGVCGADRDTIVARNLLRHIAAGGAAHSDHGRDVAHILTMIAGGHTHDYEVRDELKLRVIANLYGVQAAGRKKDELAKLVGEKVLAEFGQQEGELRFISRAPLKRQEIWRKLNVVPRGIDREIVEAMHRVNMGVDTDYRNILMQGVRAALADGWGGSMISTELQDIILGSPAPIRGKVNLGVLKEDEVNVVVHGHEPALSEVAVKAAKDPALAELARNAGAKGINIVGMCCTANEVLMRHGVPVAGNFLQQELAILTGAVEVLMVDVQCIMPALAEIASCFHTEIITTSPKARFPGVKYMEFDERRAYESAKEIIKMAVDNFKNRRKEKVSIPKETMDIVAGFSAEVIHKILGGTYRATYRPLNDAIISGRIRGVAGVVGCNNPKTTHDWAHLELVKELLKNDVIVLETGCAALACGKAGMLRPEAAFEYAGRGLQEVCEAVGIPPVLHMGACVDNSRILIAACEVLKEGGLGEDISDLPAAGAAPEWMSEKAVAIGQYFVASGVFTVFGVGLPVGGSDLFCEHIFKEFEKIYGGMWATEPDPSRMAAMIIDHINKKREKLGIAAAKERVLFDMQMRRDLEA